MTKTPLQKAGFLLTLISYGLLVPGVTKAIMTISATMNMFGLKAEIFKETRSIWETVETLWKTDYAEVAIMIVTFSVVIPALKGLLILWTWFKPSELWWKIIAGVSKWSMADVFVVAILVAFFSAKATAELSAQLHEGFYWFTGYCILSIISGQMLQPSSKTAHEPK